MSFKPSKYQDKIYEEFNKTNHSIAISAVPGSGKTSTLLQLLKLVPRTKKTLFVAFNKSISDEIQIKVDERIRVSTLHSLGYKTLLKNTDHQFELNQSKTFILGKKYLDLSHLENFKDRTYHLMMVCKAVDLYRMNLCTDEESLSAVLEDYTIDTKDNLIGDTVELMKHIDRYNRSSFFSEKHMIDFTDMLYLTSQLDSKCFEKYNVVMFDESQDANKLQLNIVEKSIKKNGRLISVGDPFQAIYHFMGASKSVFETMKQRPKTSVLPLSYCYRCGTSIVAEANKIFNVIESPEGQFEGKVSIGEIDDIKVEDYIICRNNLPLVNLYLYLTERSIPCFIMGKEYGESLIQIIKKVDSENVNDKVIKDLLEKKYMDLKGKKIKDPRKHPQYIALLEKLSVIKVVQAEYRSKGEVTSAIEHMFGDKGDRKSVILSTIHKSKGLEADRVFFMLREEIPSKYAITPAEIFAEKCLKYVGITRAKKELVYLDNLPFECKENNLEKYLDYLNIDYKGMDSYFQLYVKD